MNPEPDYSAAYVILQIPPDFDFEVRPAAGQTVAAQRAQLVI